MKVYDSGILQINYIYRSNQCFNISEFVITITNCSIYRNKGTQTTTATKHQTKAYITTRHDPLDKTAIFSQVPVEPKVNNSRVNFEQCQ